MVIALLQLPLLVPTDLGSRNLGMNIYFAKRALGWSKKPPRTRALELIEVNRLVRGEFSSVSTEKLSRNRCAPRGEEKEVLVLPKIQSYAGFAGCCFIFLCGPRG